MLKDLKKAAKKDKCLKSEPIYVYSTLTEEDTGEDFIYRHKDEHPNSKFMKFLLETNKDYYEEELNEDTE